MKFTFRIKDAVRIPMTITGLPFGQGVDVSGIGLYITAEQLAELQIRSTNTIGTMDNLTLGFFDPYRLKEIST